MWVISKTANVEKYAFEFLSYKSKAKNLNWDKWIKKKLKGKDFYFRLMYTESLPRFGKIKKAAELKKRKLIFWLKF